MHYIYKTTNLVNSKIYIGVHTTNNPDDGYMGSGKILKRAITKYGVENFEKIILETFDSREECLAREREIVNHDFISRADTYNLKIGGEGGFYRNYWDGRTHSAETKSKMSERHKLNYSDPVYLAEQTQRIKDHIKRRQEDGTYIHNFTGKTHTNETKAKIGRANAKAQKGSGNSNFGKRWMYSMAECKSIPVEPSDWDRYESEGWKFGRKMKF